MPASSSTGRSFDAVIVGGGPAGSVAALLLARAGWRTALIERRAPGQAKTCGHCLSGRGVALLQRLGLLEGVIPADAARIDSLRVHLPGTKGRSVALGPRNFSRANTTQIFSDLLRGPPWPSVVNRATFDQALLRRAEQEGVALWQPARAGVDLDGGGGVVTVRQSGHSVKLLSPLVIGADGLRSAVAAAAGLGGGAALGKKFGFCFAMHSASRSIGGGVIHMFAGGGGYLGVVRQDPVTLHVAALVQSPHRLVGDRSPMRFVHQMARQFEPLADLGIDENGPEPPILAAGPMPWRPRSVASGCAALVGDAAGYVEPFTGEGMTWAIESAIALAEAVGGQAAPGGPGGWSSMTAALYQRLWRRRIAAAHARCRAISWLLERPRITAALLGRSRWPARMIAGHLARRVLVKDRAA